MASSTYRAITMSRRSSAAGGGSPVDCQQNLFGKYLTQEFSDTVVHTSSYASKLVRGAFQKQDEAISQSKVWFLMADGKNHTCRETLLNFLYRASLCVDYEKFANSIALINYFREDGVSLSQSRIQKIQAFDERFLRSDMSGIRIAPQFQNVEGIVLYMRFTQGKIISRLMKISLILWIFRHEGILDECLSEFSNVSNLANLFRWLKIKFLENSTWGDSANPNLALSIYCYFQELGDDSTHVDWVNGPSNYIGAVFEPQLCKQYLENVYFRVKKTMSVATDEDGFAYCSRKIQAGLRSIAEILRTNKNLEEKVKHLNSENVALKIAAKEKESVKSKSKLFEELEKQIKPAGEWFEEEIQEGEEW